MKNILMIMLAVLLAMNVSACSPDNSLPLPEIPKTELPDNNGEEENQEKNDNMKFLIKVGSTTFTATFTNNETVKAFKTMLPMTISMNELNNNEKYCYLPNNLPTAPSRRNIISSGDIMLYGSNCLVLFYKTISTSYSYTNIGAIDNPSGLQSTLGTGSVTVVFEQLQD